MVFRCFQSLWCYLFYIGYFKLNNESTEVTHTDTKRNIHMQHMQLFLYVSVYLGTTRGNAAATLSASQWDLVA